MKNMRMRKGFTLIELLIVVAIIGILAALLVPNALTALQKAKQKSCMKEIMTISTGAMDYITDNGTWDAVAQDGDLAAQNQFIAAIVPFYIRNVPVNDPWNEPYKVHVGEEATEGVLTSVDADQVGEEDFVIMSTGRDNGLGPDYLASAYDDANPDAQFYNVTNMSDFNYDLVAWSGNWIVGPVTYIVD